MRFGGQTISFTAFTKSGTADELGNYALTPTVTDAPFCRHRPMAFEEVVAAELDVATQWWRSTIPVHAYDAALRAAVMSVAPDAVMEVDGVPYQVHGGPRTHPDMAGNPFKTTIISKKQTG